MVTIGYQISCSEFDYGKMKKMVLDLLILEGLFSRFTILLIVSSNPRINSNRINAKGVAQLYIVLSYNQLLSISII